MKRSKKALSIVLAVFTLLAAVPFASAAQDAGEMFISEICFNPGFEENGKKLKTDNDFFEFIEITNISGKPVDMTDSFVEYSKSGLKGESRYKNRIVFESGNDRIMEPGETWVIGVYTILTPRRGVGYSTDAELAGYWKAFNACYSSSVPVSQRALAAAAESGREAWLPGCSSLPNTGSVGGLLITAEVTEEYAPDPEKPDETLQRKISRTLSAIEYCPDEYSADGYALQFSLSGSKVTAEGSSGCSPLKIYNYQLPDSDSRPAPAGEQYSLTTMNVCYAIGSEPAEGTADDYTVIKRSERLLGYLKRNPADIICLQEISGEWWAPVTGGLGSAYGRVGESCYGAKGGETINAKDTYNPVFYKLSVFDLLDFGNFWLLGSQPSIGNKVCTWAILRSRETGSTFAVFNAHLSANDPKKTDDVSVDYTDRDSELNPLYSRLSSVISSASARFGTPEKYFPVVLCGDFNLDEGSSGYNKIVKSFGFDDAKYTARKNQLRATFNLWGKKTEDNGMIYDYCFLKNGADAGSYSVVTDKGDDGFLISDHFAAEISLFVPSNDFAVNTEPADPNRNTEEPTGNDILQKIAAFFKNLIAWLAELFKNLSAMFTVPAE